ncbi:MAG: DegV family protein [Clostridium sp.]|nr:DegV family protein [Clostridium sp.]
MEKIAIITDSASDVSVELLKENNIKLLPFRVFYKDKEYADRVELTPDMMYERLEHEIPKTSLPSTELIINTLDQLAGEGYTHAIFVTISQALSGTFNAVRLICEDYDKLKTFVFDSMTLTMAEGAMVLEAARLVKEGKSFDEIVEALPKYKDKIELFFTIDTLEYLQKGGRIGRVAGVVGQFLNLKPIITVADDGKYTVSAKARGSKQAISKLENIARTYLEKNKYKVWVLEGNGKEKAHTLIEEIKKMPNVVECTYAGTIGPALGINTGPGLVGFALERID